MVDTLQLSLPPVLLEIAGSNAAVMWVSGALLALIVAGESSLRNYRRNRIERYVRDESKRKKLLEVLETDRNLLDSLVILRLVATIALTLAIADSVTKEALTQHTGDLLRRVGLVFLILIVFVYGIIRHMARGAPERTLLLLLGPMRAIDRVLFPIRFVLNQIELGISRMLGIEKRGKSEEAEFREEILDAVSGGEQTGVIEETQAEMIEKLVDFRDSAVSEVMTPRTKMFSLPVDLSFEDALEAAIESGHSRIPLHEETVDHVIGILMVKELLRYWGRRQTDLPTLRSMMRPALFIPETKRIKDLLKEFQSGSAHMAIVLDEYGGTAGLVTIEDVVEEIVGEIRDELDHDEAAQPRPLVRRGEHEAEVAGQIRIGELNEAMHLAIPEDGSYDTIGGFLFSRIGRIPRRGEGFAFENVKFEILEADGRQINRVKVLTEAQE
jgi:CBS domain containing-hemolysin-like protein